MPRFFFNFSGMRRSASLSMVVLLEYFNVFHKEVGTVYYFSGIHLVLARLLRQFDKPFMILVVICQELFSTLDYATCHPLFEHVFNLVYSDVIGKTQADEDYILTACVVRMRAPTGFDSLKSIKNSGNLDRYATPSV